ncbi:hypothetical protein VTN77DRAFT_6012 [Rasamsonia byssochlamydoides]|uniref:uncharacterized protein n=1 Tax=Rasamsonia byssochlamydoides TaxID=89139 RepID=UPI0037445975
MGATAAATRETGFRAELGCGNAQSMRYPGRGPSLFSAGDEGEEGIVESKLKLATSPDGIHAGRERFRELVYRQAVENPLGGVLMSCVPETHGSNGHDSSDQRREARQESTEALSMQATTYSVQARPVGDSRGDFTLFMFGRSTVLRKSIPDMGLLSDIWTFLDLLYGDRRLASVRGKRVDALGNCGEAALGKEGAVVNLGRGVPIALKVGQLHQSFLQEGCRGQHMMSITTTIVW